MLHKSGQKSVISGILLKVKANKIGCISTFMTNGIEKIRVEISLSIKFKNRVEMSACTLCILAKRPRRLKKKAVTSLGKGAYILSNL